MKKADFLVELDKLEEEVRNASIESKKKSDEVIFQAKVRASTMKKKKRDDFEKAKKERLAKAKGEASKLTKSINDEYKVKMSSIQAKSEEKKSIVVERLVKKFQANFGN